MSPKFCSSPLLFKGQAETPLHSVGKLLALQEILSDVLRNVLMINNNDNNVYYLSHDGGG